MKVLANDGISEAGREALNEAGIEVLDNRVSAEHLANFINENHVDVLLVRSATQVTRELLDECPGLKVVGRGGVGMDNIDVEYAEEIGVTVINTPNASTRSVAELVFAHFFSLARNLHEANRLMPLEGDTQFSELKRSFAKSFELEGKTLGVLGMGKIGLEVAKIGISLGMKVLCYNRSEKTKKVTLHFFDDQKLTFTLKSLPLDEVIQNADFISVNTSKTSHYILDAPEYAKMKDGVFIVNAARGGVLNEVSLLDFIEEGKIAGAALDVFENEPNPELPLLMNPALSLSPHIGGSTIDAQQKIGKELAAQLIKLQ